MKRGSVFKVLIILFVISFVFTVTIATIENSSQPKKIVGTSVDVLPANVIWAKTYGVLGDDDRVYDALPVGTGSLIVGSSESNITGLTVGLAVMFDQNGNVIWSQTYIEGSGTEIRCALNLSDGFLLVGNEILPAGDFNGYVAKIDPQGNLIWNITIGSNETDEFYSGFSTSDGFVLLGLSSSNGGAESQAWAVKIDSYGNLVWDKTYSFASNTVAKTGVLAPDGNYVIGGYADPQGASNYDFLLMKLDPSGDLIWNQTYSGSGSEEATAMATTPDGYVMVGNTQLPNGNMHALVVKVDLNGGKIWTKTVGGESADSPSCITPSIDGGYLVGGFTFSFGAGNRDFWLFKLNDSGQVVWSCTQGNPAYQEAYAVIQTGKNQYLMVGWTDPPGQPGLIGKARYMFYVVSISYPLSSKGVSDLQVIYYAVITADILQAILLVMLKLSYKPNIAKRE